MTAPLGLGVVGAGGFATFIAGAVADLPDVVVRAVADPRRHAAQALADAHGADVADDWRRLLEDDRVEAVVVATPPAEHARIATTALQAGRHVFCEKPLALGDDSADRLVDTVRGTGRALVVDHVLRYNPILCALRRLDGELLGPLQRFCLENDASDENLPEAHWFWDRRLSGGIFVEHGVHFFDAATMLTGRPPTSVHAVTARREHGPVDMATATVLHGADVLATHTHSFTHAHRCERQLMRLDYGSAEARVEGWIPVHAVIDLWTDDAGAKVTEGLPGRTAELMHVDGFRLDERAAVAVEVTRDAGDPHARGRGTDLDIPHHACIALTLGGAPAKGDIYAESVRAAMADLVRAARDRTEPHSGVHEGAAAVRTALAAARSADLGRRIEIVRR